jgi:hypothetical protein
MTSQSDKTMDEASEWRLRVRRNQTSVLPTILNPALCPAISPFFCPHLRIVNLPLDFFKGRQASALALF